MSWKDLFKPKDIDPKNVVEWLGLITDDIRKLKNTDNWYDEVKVLTSDSIVDNLETDIADFSLSARQGKVLNTKIGVSDKAISVLEEDVSQLQLKSIDHEERIDEIVDVDLPLINQNISDISDEVVNQGDRLDGHDTAIEVINADIAGITERVEDNETAITELQERSTIIETDIDNIEKRVEDNEADISLLKIHDSEVDGEIVAIKENIIEIVDLDNRRIDNLVGDNVKISGLNVSVNQSDMNVTISPGTAIICGKLIEVKSNVVISINSELLSENGMIYTIMTMNNDEVEFILSKTDMDKTTLRIHSMVVVNGGIYESNNNSDMISMSSVVGLTADNEAENIRQMIPSGFTTLGELDFDFMVNNENKVKMKSDSIAYVNGYKIEIPKDTIIDIGRAPEKEMREDLLFLECWKDIDFPKTGKLKYRIRHEENVEFTTNRVHGQFITELTNNLFIQGCKSELSQMAFVDNKWLNESGNTVEDVGLWRAASSRIDLGYSIDGYCYAIPVFRLYRKASYGKIEPYEYTKLNKLCDYNKASSLVKEEKVERVVNETIQGKTLLNHATKTNELNVTGTANNTITTTDNSINVVVGTVGSCVVYTNYLTILKPTTKYTILVDMKYTRQVSLGTRINDGNFVSTPVGSSLSIGMNKICFNSPEDTSKFQLWIGDVSPMPINSSFTTSKLMILEGDWTSKEIPEYFEGLSSLGQDENNLLLVKNGIVQYPTYNPVIGNQKLTTNSEVTYISSDNDITPTFEAQLKRGDEKISDVNNYGKIETTGDEIVEFTKIKGRTIQNLLNLNNCNIVGSVQANIEYKSSDKITVRSTTIGSFVAVILTPLLKKDTIYNIKFNLTSNFTCYLGFNVDDDFTVGLSTDNPLNINGENVINVRTPNIDGELKGITIGLHSDIPIANSSITITDIIMVTDDIIIPNTTKFIEDIKSVGEINDNKVIINSRGKNFYPGISQAIYPDATDTWYFVDGIVGAVGNMITKTNTWFTLPAGTYKFDYNGSYMQICKVDESYAWTRGQEIILDYPTKMIVRVKGQTGGISGINFSNLKITSVDDFNTSYQSYKEYKQEIHLKEPLRSLPSGVCDEIVGNKVIRRVGKIILDGSEASYTLWIGSDDNELTVNVYLDNKIIDCVSFVSDNLLTNTLPCVYNSFIERKGNSIIIANYLIHIAILKSNLPSPNIGGVKTWLKSNPTTVYYELETPIEETIEYYYDTESMKTYQLTEPLRSIPGGVFDSIENGMLIRRCGELDFTGDNDSVISEYTIHGNVANELTTVISVENNLYTGTPIEYYNDNHGIGSNIEFGNPFRNVVKNVVGRAGRYFYFRILKSELKTQTVDGFKSWLRANPVKVIFELDSPIYTKLNEVPTREAEYNLDRQFKQGNWLRELPNGVNDYVNGDKVIRNVGVKTINDTEEWLIRGSTDTVIVFGGIDILPLSPNENVPNILCDKLKTVKLSDSDEGIINGTAYGYTPMVRILKSRLSSLDVTGFKSWLSKNPITVLYELATPTEEPLTDDNFIYYPSHELNTTNSNLYVTDGYNRIDILNNVKSDSNIIETSYRVINDNSEIEDTHYKPSENGKELSYTIPKGKNKINMFDYINSEPYKSIIYRNGDKITFSTTLTSASFPFRYFIRLKPNTTYTLSCNLESTSNRGALYVINSPIDRVVNVNNYNWQSKLVVGEESVVFKTDSIGSIILTTNIYSTTQNIAFTLSNLQIEEGSVKTQYEEFIPNVRAFENVESNDVVDIRKTVSMTGYNYEKMLNKTFDSLLKGEI